jgi:hypothetical protein
MSAFAIDTSIAEDFRAAWGDRRRHTREQRKHAVRTARLRLRLEGGA